MKSITLYYWEEPDGSLHKSQTDNIPANATKARKAIHYVPTGMNVDYFVNKLSNTPPVSSISIKR